MVLGSSAIHTKREKGTSMNRVPVLSVVIETEEGAIKFTFSDRNHAYYITTTNIDSERDALGKNRKDRREWLDHRIQFQTPTERRDSDRRESTPSTSESISAPSDTSTSSPTLPLT